MTVRRIALIGILAPLDMSDAEYPAPRVIETSAPCPPLARLPKLPVTVLVLDRGEADEERKGLAHRLARLADELGVGEGVQVVEHRVPDWDYPLEGLDVRRFDAVFVRSTDLPGALDDFSEPADGLIDGLSLLLADAETRFYVLAPPPPDHPDRRDALALRLAERGSPPAVVVPAAWDEAAVAHFLTTLFERSLHDWPLARAVTDAAAGELPVPVIYQPPGRRHGLDLGRLLEDHRRKIEEGVSSLRMLSRELQAAGPDERGPLARIAADAPVRQTELEEIKAAVEEINRDRDPAGWSRLAESIARLQRWEEDLERARQALEAHRLAGS